MKSRQAGFWGFAGVLLLLFLPACGRGPGGPTLVGSPGDPVPATAIALSIESDAVYLVNPDSGVRRRVVGGLEDEHAGFAAWDPGHGLLAYGDAGIFVFDTRTSSVRALAHRPGLAMPAWSPDGGTVAYGDGVSVWLTGTALPRTRELEVPSDVAPFDFAWQPGEVIAFSGLALDCDTAAGCVSTDLSELQVMADDGTGPQTLTRVGHAERPKWSADGSRLLFVRRLGGQATPRSLELWEVGRDGSDLRQILPVFDVVAADWSPAGDRLAILRPGGAPGTLQLWVGRADGSDLRAVGSAIEGTRAAIDW